MKFKKLISSSLAIGLIFNSVSTSFASILSEDGRYEIFEGNNITIDNILEEDKVDVEIEGNTMVNLILDGKALKLNTLENAPTSSYYYLNVNLRYPLKANTTYTISFNIASNPYNHIPLSSIVLGQGDEDEGYNLDAWSYRLHWDKHFNMKPDEPGLGRYSATFTTPSRIEETSFNWIGIIGERTGGQPYDTTIEDLILVEGEHKLDNYFEGMKSVGELEDNKIEILSQNKNLFRKDLIQKGNLSGNPANLGMEISNPNGYKRTDFIKIKPNTSYCVSINEDVFRLEKKILFDKNKKAIKEVGNIFNSENAHYLRVIFAKKTETEVEVSNEILLQHNIQIEEGNTVTTHVEGKQNKKEILMNEPLRSLPNGVKDRIVKRNGQWVIERNCGVLAINENTSLWAYNESSNINSDRWAVGLTNTLDKYVGSKGISNSLNHYSLTNMINDSNLEGFSNYTDSSLEYNRIYLYIKNNKVGIIDSDTSYQRNEKVKKWLIDNNTEFIYELSTPIYEPLNIDSTINTYLDVTHISNNSTIPANMKITIDRTINRAVEAMELAKINPTVANISQARMWSNLLKESIKKDELNNEINIITNIEDLQLERKTASANMDVYIKSENMLLMSLSTNSITFEDYSGVEDIELNNAINISINSSLPYQLNSYLLSEIENSDKSNRIEKDLLNIKTSKDSDYKTFNNINEKLILEDDCRAGNNKSHSIDLKLKGSQAHKADIYKTVIKFEAEQK